MLLSFSSAVARADLVGDNEPIGPGIVGTTLTAKASVPMGDLPIGDFQQNGKVSCSFEGPEVFSPYFMHDQLKVEDAQQLTDSGKSEFSIVVSEGFGPLKKRYKIACNEEGRHAFSVLDLKRFLRDYFEFNPYADHSLEITKDLIQSILGP